MADSDLYRTQLGDILKRLEDVIAAWERVLPAGEMVSVRADLIVSAYSEIAKLREQVQ